jgi:hypothetical protein
LSEVLLSNIAFQPSPVGGGVAHLRKERRLEPARLVGGIERVVSQLAWIDARSRWRWTATRHDDIVPSRRKFSQEVWPNETDLDALLVELVRVVDEALQPEHVSVWLRKQETPKSTSGLLE